MINVSKAFRKALAEDKRDFTKSAKMTLRDGTVLNITDANIWANGFAHEDSVSDDNELDIGNAVVNAFSLTLNNIYEDFSAYDFQGAEVIPKISLTIDDVPEEIQMGIYTVDEAKYNGSIITLSCLDNMIFFDKPYSESSLVYPATLNTIVRNACTICGVPLGTLTFPHDDYIVQTRPSEEATTFRDVISYAAQIAGCFARVNVNGSLEIKWFNQTALEALDENLDGGIFDDASPYASGDTADGGVFNPWNTGYVYDAGDLTEYEDIHFIVGLYSQEISTDYVVVTGIHVIAENSDGDDTTYTSGTDGYVIEIKDNPFITASTAQNIANWLGQQFIGLKYKKANVSHQNDPTIEAGDLAVVWDRNNHGSPILVTRTVFKASGKQQTVSAAETPTKNSTERFSQQTKNFVELRKRVKQQLGTFEQTQEELARRIENAGGLYKTEVTQQDGSTIIYYHDKPDLADSQIRFVITNVGITITPDGGTTWYGLTVDGQLISSILNTVGVNADWINVGEMLANRIRGGTLTLGGDNNEDGVLRVLDANGNVIGSWDNTGASIVGDLSMKKTINNVLMEALFADVLYYAARSLSRHVPGMQIKAGGNGFDLIPYFGNEATTFGGSVFQQYAQDHKTIYRMVIENGGGLQYPEYVAEFSLNPNINDDDYLSLTYAKYRTYYDGTTGLIGSAGLTLGRYRMSISNERAKLSFGGQSSGAKAISVSAQDPNGSAVLEASSRSLNYTGKDTSDNTVASFVVSSSGGTINGNTIAYASSSSKRFKHDIDTLKETSMDPERLLNLEAKQFRYNEGHPLQYADMEGELLPGFIAEDVAEIYPAAAIHDADGNVQSWDERRIIPGMLELIKSQKKRIDELEARLLRLESLVEGR